MKIDTFKCDVCGQIKGENNRWLRVDSAIPRLELHAWDDIPSSSSTLDICSDQCVMKTVQQWLSAQAVMQTTDSRHRDARGAVVSIGGGQRAS